MKTTVRPLYTSIALLISCIGILCPLQIQGQSQDQPQPGPEHKKLEAWVGEWSYEGGGPASPFGPAAKFQGKASVRMVLNGFFLEDRWQDTSDNGYVTQGIVLTGYDSTKKTYTEYGFENDGLASSTVSTLEGNVCTSVGTRIDKTGKVYKTKFIRVLATDGNGFTQKAEYSSDDGKTWLLWWELTAKKNDAKLDSRLKGLESFVGRWQPSIVDAATGVSKALPETLVIRVDPGGKSVLGITSGDASRLKPGEPAPTSY
ncbi:MAG: DUF1579 family protein, partial [Verrucomicrobiae bacterium]|nr:DUF1579 family protein [Verrucomicrobiae bacterium]